MGALARARKVLVLLLTLQVGGCAHVCVCVCVCVVVCLKCVCTTASVCVTYPQHECGRAAPYSSSSEPGFEHDTLGANASSVSVASSGVQRGTHLSYLQIQKAKIDDHNTQVRMHTHAL